MTQPGFTPPPEEATELAKALVEANAAEVPPMEPDTGLPPTLLPAGVIAEEVKSEQRRYPGAGMLDAFAHLMTLVVFALFILTFLAQPFRIPSESMEPTLLVGDFVLVDKVSVAPAGEWRGLLPYAPLRRGTPVVFHYPVNADEFLVKRIVAGPGDRLKLVHGHVMVNGVLQPEPYAIYLPSGYDAYRDSFPAMDVTPLNLDPQWSRQMHSLVQNGELVVPQDEYFVMGDNRNHSLDSRYWGFVPRANITGEPALIYFSVRSPSPDEDQLPGDRMSRQQDGVARWDRVLRAVR